MDTLSFIASTSKPCIYWPSSWLPGKCWTQIFVWLEAQLEEIFISVEDCQQPFGFYPGEAGCDWWKHATKFNRCERGKRQLSNNCITYSIIHSKTWCMRVQLQIYVDCYLVSIYFCFPFVQEMKLIWYKNKKNYDTWTTHQLCIADAFLKSS